MLGIYRSYPVKLGDKWIPSWMEQGGYEEPPIPKDENHDDSMMLSIFSVPMTCRTLQQTLYVAHLILISSVLNFLFCFFKFNTFGCAISCRLYYNNLYFWDNYFGETAVLFKYTIIPFINIVNNRKHLLKQ